MKLLSLFCLFLSFMICGCQSATVVNLDSPSGAILAYNGGLYTFPAQVHFLRPDDREDSYKTPVSVTIPTIEGGMLTVNGILEVFGHDEHHTDVYNPHKLQLFPAQLEMLSTGQRVLYEGKSDSGYRIFNLDLRP